MLDANTRKVLEQLLLDIDSCRHNRETAGTTYVLMINRIRGLLESPEEKEARLARVAAAKARVAAARAAASTQLETLIANAGLVETEGQFFLHDPSQCVGIPRAPRRRKED